MPTTTDRYTRPWDRLLREGKWQEALGAFGFTASQQSDILNAILARFAQEGVSAPQYRLRPYEFRWDGEEHDSTRTFMLCTDGGTAKVMMFMHHTGALDFRVSMSPYNMMQCRWHQTCTCHESPRDEDEEDDFDECPYCALGSDWCTYHSAYHE